MIALIMAGGIGSRFWPLSRKDNPKQFLPIVSSESMIRLTVDRLKQKIDIKDIYVVTALDQVDLVKKHLPELAHENIIVEPFGMNTAPCIGLSLAWLQDKYSENETMLVAAADHLITKPEDFYKCLDTGIIAAHKDNLVTYGILPDYPATSYGYIECGSEIMENTFAVERFKEKPDVDTAARYLQTHRFLWNSGMFTWKLSTIRKAFQELQPEIWDLLQSISEHWKINGREASIDQFYSQMPKIPVDIGIMEMSENIAVIPADIGWSDVGGWKALADLAEKDQFGNSTKFPELYNIDSSNNYVYSQKMVSLIGVDNLVIVDTEDALLIMNKERSEEVKKLVNMLKEEKQDKYL